MISADRTLHGPPPNLLERTLSLLLRLGVGISLAVVMVGMILSFAHHPGYLSSAVDLQALTTPGQAMPHTLHDTIDGVLALRGQAFVALGLMLLVATPVMRVAASVIAFGLQRDWIFTLITACVLGFLLLSFLLGRVNG